MKRLSSFLMILFCITTGLNAQVKDNSGQAEKPAAKVVKRPEPKGGMEAFHKFIREHMVYPKEAAAAKIQGIVVPLFLVDESGKIELKKLVREVDAALDQEAIRLLMLSEKELGWIPGEVDGKVTTLEQVVPIHFQLPYEPGADNTSEEEVEMEAPPVPPFFEQKAAAPEKNKEKQETIFVLVEEDAMPEGGMKAFYEEMAKNMKYPAKALQYGIEGRAFVRFIINEKGEVESAEILEGRELGYGLDEEAIRLIKMTKWIPGKMRGKAVTVRKVLPVTFKLPAKK